MLLAHRTLPPAAVVAGIEGALAVGSLDPEVVVVEARRFAQSASGPPAALSGLARFDRPSPSLAGYDELLEDSG